jgi:hypothetical protein
MLKRAPERMPPTQRHDTLAPLAWSNSAGQANGPEASASQAVGLPRVNLTESRDGD